MPDDTKADVRQLTHKLRNHLFTISLGVQALELTPNDPERLSALLEQMREELAGIDQIADALDSVGKGGDSD